MRFPFLKDGFPVYDGCAVSQLGEDDSFAQDLSQGHELSPCGSDVGV